MGLDLVCGTVVRKENMRQSQAETQQKKKKKPSAIENSVSRTINNRASEI